jgi:hypothetical protein
MKFMIEVQYINPDHDKGAIVEDIKSGLESYGLEVVDINQPSAKMWFVFGGLHSKEGSGMGDFLSSFESKETADIYANENLWAGYYDWVQVIDIAKFMGA